MSEEITRDELIEMLREHPRYCDLPMVQSMAKARGPYAGQRKIRKAGRDWEVPFKEYILAVDPRGDLQCCVIRSNRIYIGDTDAEGKGADFQGHRPVLEALRDKKKFEDRGFVFVDLDDRLRLEDQLPKVRAAKDYGRLADLMIERRQAEKTKRAEHRVEIDASLKQAKTLGEVLMKIQERQSGQPKTSAKPRTASAD